MAVVNGEDVEATLVNSRFMSRTQDTTTIGRVGLQNISDPLSGPALGNVQEAINETFDAVGMTGENDLTRNDYSSNNVVTNGDDRKVAVGKLDERFSGTTGHVHDGTDSNGPKVDAANLDNINLLFAEWQTVNVLGVTGSSFDVSALFAAKSPGGGVSSLGVITSAPFNKVAIFNATTLDQFEDAEGQKVFGRFTEAAGVWTLSYFTNESGVETAYSFASSVDQKIFFFEVFDQATRPTIPTGPEFGSLDLSADVVDATSTQRGLVSTLTQSFGGDKTFDGIVNADNGLNVFGETTLDGALKFPSQDDSGVGPGHIVALGSFIRLTGAGLAQIEGLFGSPADSVKFVVNKTGGSVVIVNESGVAGTGEKIQIATGTNYNLKPNQGAFFIFDATADRWVLLSVAEPSFSVGPVLGSVNANGATYSPSTGVFQLAPAANTFPGIVTEFAQEFSGVKTFKDDVLLDSNEIQGVSKIQGVTTPSAYLIVKSPATGGGVFICDPSEGSGLFIDNAGASFLTAQLDFTLTSPIVKVQTVASGVTKRGFAITDGGSMDFYNLTPLTNAGDIAFGAAAGGSLNNTANINGPTDNVTPMILTGNVGGGVELRSDDFQTRVKVIDSLAEVISQNGSVQIGASGGDVEIVGTGNLDMGAKKIVDLAAATAPTDAVNFSQLDLKNDAIQFQDEGSNLGLAGEIDTINFTGAGVTATKTGSTLEVAVTGGGGGGGGTPSLIPLVWRDYIVGPLLVEDSVSNLFVAQFDQNGDQFLKTLFIVPPNYTVGKQIKLLFGWFTYDSTFDTVEFIANVSLFSGALPAVNAPTDVDQYSTGAIGTNANAFVTQEVNLTSAIGQIGATQVQPGDKIIVRFTRGSAGVAEPVFVCHENAGGYIVP